MYHSCTQFSRRIEQSMEEYLRSKQKIQLTMSLTYRLNIVHATLIMEPKEE
jgi:hypothetical protein